MSVVSKTAETNVRRSYWVSRLAGARIGKIRVVKGEELVMSEHQARALLLSGEIVAAEALVDDPWGEAAAAKAAQDALDKAAAEARAAAAKPAATKAPAAPAAAPAATPAPPVAG